MAIRITNNNYGGRVTMSSRGLGGKFSYIADPVKFLLNDYPGAAAAYSLRKLDYTYTGPAIRVRRSSDNAEQNIGFVNNVLDTTSLLTFCGAGNGFVTTWYDQSGNSKNISQSTLANQPQIVTSGVVNLQGTKPTITFNGTTQFLTTTDTGLPINNATYIALTRTFTNPSTYYVHFSYGLNNLGSNVSMFYGATDNSPSSSTLGFTNYGISSGTINRSPNIYNLQILFKPTSPSGVWNQYINNIFLSSFTNIANTTLSGTFNLGSGLGYYFGGNLQEIVVYPTQETANRTSMETNINSFYSIY